MYKVFIDGKEGTTGLRIYDRLLEREDIQIITLSEEQRKNTSARADMINSSDITFLCLPDDAARESVSLAENKNVRIIDASTAHRTLSGWVYGFPELSDEQRQRIRSSNRTAVPGCHASGFIALVYPLIKNKAINADYPLSCFSITGYSGGGKKMIADYENDDRAVEFGAPRQYATRQEHKHLKEMQKIAGLERPPVFSPIISDFYSGMAVSVPLIKSFMNKKYSPEDVAKIYENHYGDSKIISCGGYIKENVFINSLENSLKDTMKVFVHGNEDRMILTALYDNLGKGASGAALQCMNIMLGLDEWAGLSL